MQVFHSLKGLGTDPNLSNLSSQFFSHFPGEKVERRDSFFMPGNKRGEEMIGRLRSLEHILGLSKIVNMFYFHFHSPEHIIT
jgi:hypothetical protein